MEGLKKSHRGTSNKAPEGKQSSPGNRGPPRKGPTSWETGHHGRCRGRANSASQSLVACAAVPDTKGPEGRQGKGGGREVRRRKWANAFKFDQEHQFRGRSPSSRDVRKVTPVRKPKLLKRRQRPWPAGWSTVPMHHGGGFEPRPGPTREATMSASVSGVTGRCSPSLKIDQ